MTEKRPSAKAVTATKTSQGPDLEPDKRVPEGRGENLQTIVTEAAAGDGVVEGLQRAGRELDRTFGGEYEAREDNAAPPEPETHTGP